MNTSFFGQPAKTTVSTTASTSSVLKTFPSFGAVAPISGLFQDARPISNSFKPYTSQPSTTFQTNTSSPFTNNVSLFNSQTESNDLSTIKQIIDKLNTNTDTPQSNKLRFQLNYLIKGIYTNVDVEKNYYTKIYELSSYLNDLDQENLGIDFILKIQMRAQDFIKHEDTDWLTKNLFDVAIATKRSLEIFFKKDVICCITNNKFQKENAMLEFIFPNSTMFFQYKLGSFQTQESFVTYVYIDILCNWLTNIWLMHNPSYSYKITREINNTPLDKSEIYITLTYMKDNYTSLGIKLNAELNQSLKNGIATEGIKSWFDKLDEIAAAIDYNVMTINNINNNTFAKCETSLADDTTEFYYLLISHLNK